MAPEKNYLLNTVLKYKIMGGFSKRSLDNLVGVHPNLVKIMKEAIKDSPVDFTITSGLRTTKEQQAEYAKGRTKPGIKVTYRDGVTKKSNHQAKPDGFGHAIDLYPYYNGAVQVHDKEVIPKLKLIAVHVKAVAKCMNLKITWGGDWKNPYDPPHFELS